MKKFLTSIILPAICIVAGAQNANPLDSKAEMTSVDEAKEIYAANASPNYLPQWDRVAKVVSADKRYVTFVLPLSATLPNPTGCAVAIQRMVIQKDLETLKSTIYFMSVAPSAGLSSGAPFSGSVVYSHVADWSKIGWEVYEGGKLAYVKDFRYEGFTDRSLTSKNLDARLDQNLVYGGNEEAISPEAFCLIAANRPRVGEAVFSKDPSKKYTPESLGLSSGEVKVFGAATSGSEYSKLMNPMAMMGNNSGGKSVSSLSKAMQGPEKMVSSRNERRDDPNVKNKFVVDRIGTNDDFCEYYVRRSSGLSYSAVPGRVTINTYANFNDANMDFPSGATTTNFRGRPLTRVDSAFVFALPVEAGKMVKLARDSQDGRAFSVQMKAGDIVLAMRAGTVCRYTSPGYFVIYHNDGTFAAYMNVTDMAVQPGQAVLPGDVLGKSGPSKLSVAFYYLDNTKISNSKDKAYTFFTPWFHTEAGDVKAETGKDMVAKLDTDLITKEMSKGAAKKYLKTLKK